MSVQNYLSNVFRQVYTYDPITTRFQPALSISNIDVVTANSVSAYTASIGDAGNNVYVGASAGNAYNFVQNCLDNVALGVFAGNSISNVSNCVYIGYNAGNGASGASNVIGIGAGASGNGSNNIYIGTGTGGPNEGNIFIGHGIADTTVSNTLYIGSNKLISADIKNELVGIATSTPEYTLDVDGYTRVMNGLGINANPMAHSLNVNGDMFVSDGYGTLQFGNDILTTSARVISQGGYSTTTGTVSVSAEGTAILYPLIRGSITTSVVDDAGIIAAFSTVIASASNAIPSIMVTNNTAGIQILYTGGNISLKNTGDETITVGWNITYYPIP